MSYLPVKFANLLKNRPVFNIFYCFWMFMNKLFTYHVGISQKVKSVLMWNLQDIFFIWRRRYWQIFKSALVYLEGFYLYFRFSRFTWRARKMAENAMFFLTNFLSTSPFTFTFKRNFCEKPLLKTTLLHVYRSHVYREAVMW